jgi:hypothetical protein
VRIRKWEPTVWQAWGGGDFAAREQHPPSVQEGPFDGLSFHEVTSVGHRRGEVDLPLLGAAALDELNGGWVAHGLAISTFSRSYQQKPKLVAFFWMNALPRMPPSANQGARLLRPACARGPWRYQIIRNPRRP